MSLSMDAQKNRHRILLYLGLSILAHFLLMVGIRHARFSDFQIPENAVYVDLNSPLPTFPPVTEAEKEKVRQVVESETSSDQTKPKDPKYLGERDQSVAEETKARQVEAFRKGGAPSKAGAGGKPSVALKDLAPKARAFTPPTKAEIDGFRERQQQQVARQESSAGGNHAPDSPGSATNDYLKDVKEGDRTLLSTKEFVYFSYYRRIRERLQVAWDSRLRSALGYSGRQLAGDRNYATGLLIVLDRFGKITHVTILQKSGARDLDQAAVDAFNDAGPFPDPPSGLVDKEGQIKLRWDFILQS